MNSKIAKQEFLNSIKKALLLITLLAFGCVEDDESSTNKISVQTKDAQVFSNGGVQLSGNINSSGQEINYGFIVSSIKESTYLQNGIIIKESGKPEGNVSLELAQGLSKGQTYYYNAFAYMSNEYFLGEEKSFVSNGSKAAVITSVEPNPAHILDTITIKGKYFGSHPKVDFDEYASFIFFKSDSLIKCLVPHASNRPEVPYSKIHINKDTETATVYEDFSLFTPEITSIEPQNAYVTNDTLIFRGNHFGINGTNLLTMDANGNNQLLEIITATRTKLIVRNTAGFFDLKPTFKLRAQLQTVVSENQLTIEIPTITGAPDCISTDQEFTIYGQHFSDGRNPSLQYINVGDISFKVKQMYQDSIIVDKQSGYANDFILKDISFDFLGQEVSFEKDMCISDPWILIGNGNPTNTHKFQGDIYGVVVFNYNKLTMGRFNPDTNAFESVHGTELPNTVFGPVSTFNNGKMYTYYSSENSDTNTFVSYDILTNQVNQLTPFPGEKRISGFMESIEDNIYFGLGASVYSQQHQDIWKYSITNDTWEKVLDFVAIDTKENAKAYPLTFTYEDKIFIGIGQRTGYHEDFWEFNTSTDQITEKESLPQVMAGVQRATVLNGKAYIENRYLYEYDIALDQWKIYSNITGVVRAYSLESSHSIFNLDGIIYRSIAGNSGTNSLYKLNSNAIEE